MSENLRGIYLTRAVLTCLGLYMSCYCRGGWVVHEANDLELLTLTSQKLLVIFDTDAEQVLWHDTRMSWIYDYDFVPKKFYENRIGAFREITG